MFKSFFLILLCLLLVNAYANERLQSLNEKIQKVENKVNGYVRYDVKFKGWREDGNWHKFKYTFYGNVLSTNCILGLSTKAVDRSSNDQVMDDKSWGRPFDLSKKLKIEMESSDLRKNYGNILRFGDEGWPLYYAKPRPFKKNIWKEHFKLLNELNTLCQERAKIERQQQNDEKSLEDLVVDRDELDLGFGISKKVGQDLRPNRLLHDGVKTKVVSLVGQQSLAYRFKIIKEAKKSIRLETLHFMGDDSGTAVANLLIQKKQEGVDVKVFIDSFTPFIDIRDSEGNLNFLGPVGQQNAFKIYRNLMAAGIPVYGFSCSNFKWKQLYNEWQELKMEGGRLLDMQRRIHDKILVVDDKKAVVGGMNIHDYYFRVEDKGAMYWRDQDVGIEGDEIVSDIAAIFDRGIKDYSDEFSADPYKKGCLNPHPIDSEKYTTFVNEKTKKYQSDLAEYDNDVTWATRVDNRIESLLDGKIEGVEFIPQFRDVLAIKAIQNRPKHDERNIENTYIDLIDQAKEDIMLTNAYFIPPKTVRDALKRAAKRGVKVEILTNGKKTNDPPVMAPLARYYYKDLLDEGILLDNPIQFYEWDGTNKETGVQEQGMLHAKLAVFDKKVVVVGSHNFDNVSHYKNTETITVIVSPELAHDFLEQFNNRDLKFAKKIKYRKVLQYKRPRGLKKDNFTDRLILKYVLKYQEYL